MMPARSIVDVTVRHDHNLTTIGKHTPACSRAMKASEKLAELLDQVSSKNGCLEL